MAAALTVLAVPVLSVMADAGEDERIPAPSRADTWITIVIAVIFVGAIVAINLLGSKRSHRD